MENIDAFDLVMEGINETINESNDEQKNEDLSETPVIDSMLMKLKTQLTEGKITEEEYDKQTKALELRKVNEIDRRNRELEEKELAEKKAASKGKLNKLASKIKDKIMKKPLKPVTESMDIPESLQEYFENAIRYEDVERQIEFDYITSTITESEYVSLKETFDTYLTESVAKEFSIGTMLPQGGESQTEENKEEEELLSKDIEVDESVMHFLLDKSSEVSMFVEAGINQFTDAVFQDIRKFSPKVTKLIVEKAIYGEKLNIMPYMEASNKDVTSVKHKLVQNEKELRRLKAGMSDDQLSAITEATIELKDFINENKLHYEMCNNIVLEKKKKEDENEPDIPDVLDSQVTSKQLDHLTKSFDEDEDTDVKESVELVSYDTAEYDFNNTNRNKRVLGFLKDHGMLTENVDMESDVITNTMLNELGVRFMNTCYESYLAHDMVGDTNVTLESYIKESGIDIEIESTGAVYNLLNMKHEIENKLQNMVESGDADGAHICENKLLYVANQFKKMVKTESVMPAIVIEAVDMEDEIKPYVAKLNAKGYKVKYSSPGHTKLRKKSDANHDGVYIGKLYTDARLMFKDDYNFPEAPKYWIFKSVEGCDYLDVPPKSYNPKDGTPDEAFAKWKKSYMETLGTWIDNLPDKDKAKDDIIVKTNSGKTEVIESANELYDDYMSELMTNIELDLM